MYQYNLSTMMLKTNGKKSSTKRTKHVRVRYFFIKDRVSSGDITLEHCPTEEILADHFTKPLQGSLFHKFLDEITNIPEEKDMNDMGWNEITEKKTVSEKLHGVTKKSSLQECVGINKMKGVTRKSKPGMMRNDDVRGTGPAGGKTSWRERYRNECTIGRYKYVRNRGYSKVTGGGNTGRP